MQQKIYSSKVIWWTCRNALVARQRMTIVFLAAAAFPYPLVKIGVRTEKEFSVVFYWRIETRFLECFKFQIFIMVWSCGLSPHFGRTCCQHLQGRIKNSKKAEVTGTSGTSLPTLKVTWWHARRPWSFLPKLPPPVIIRLTYATGEADVAVLRHLWHKFRYCLQLFVCLRSTQLTRVENSAMSSYLVATALNH